MTEYSQDMAVIVQPGYDDTFDVLAREFRPRGVAVFWDRRKAERRRHLIPVAVERRAARRRQNVVKWNVLHFCVAQLTEAPTTAETADVRRR